MNYTQIREIAQDGDIMFLRVDKRNILSRTTSWFTNSPYTHAAFLFWYKNRLMIVESTTHGGIRIVQASTYSDRDIDLVKSPRYWEEIQEKALERSGTANYGWISAAYIGIRDFFFTHFNINLPQNKNNRNKACSEFVAEVLELQDVDISPAKLYRTLSQLTKS